VCLVSLQSAGPPPEGPKCKGLITWKPLSGFPSSFPRLWFVGGPRGDDAGAPHFATALELCPTSNVFGANESEIESGRLIVEWSLAYGPTMQVPSLVIRPLDPTHVTTGPNAYTKSSHFSVSSIERLSHISTVFPRAVTATAALRQLLADIAALRFARALGTLGTAPSGRLRRRRTQRPAAAAAPAAAPSPPRRRCRRRTQGRRPRRGGSKAAVRRRGGEEWVLVRSWGGGGVGGGGGGGGGWSGQRRRGGCWRRPPRHRTRHTATPTAPAAA